MRQRIEDSPQALAEFTRRATKTDGPIVGVDAQARGAFQTLTNGELSVDERTVLDIGGQDFLHEIRLLCARYGEQAAEILIPTVVLAPNILKSPQSARAQYQLCHQDLMGDFPGALQVLERFGVSVTREHATRELAAWAEQQLTDARTGPRIRKHFDLRLLAVEAPSPARSIHGEPS